MGSVATKFNFFIHNLAQRFSGIPVTDEAILSFSPKAYSMKQDGRIREASIFTYHKRYNPDKYYVSVRIVVFMQIRSSLAKNLNWSFSVLGVNLVKGSEVTF